MTLQNDGSDITFTDSENEDMESWRPFLEILPTAASKSGMLSTAVFNPEHRRSVYVVVTACIGPGEGVCHGNGLRDSVGKGTDIY